MIVHVGFFADLVGEWQLRGEVLGRPLEQAVTADVVLGGAWVRVRFHSSTVTPLTEEPYAADVYLGREDSSDDRYLMVLMDTFGAGSWAPGRGRLADGVVGFRFDYSDGAMLTTWQRDGGDWLIEQWRAPDGERSLFGRKRLAPIRD